MNRDNSKKIYEKALEVLPGGVNSPVRAFKSVDTTPVFIKKADGCYVFDEDNHKYLDFISSWGPMILGHNNPIISEELKNSVDLGISYGLPSAIEVELAEKIVDAYEGVDMVRMVNSGTEATMSAIRLARGYTKKNKIIKFEGNYHGHNDSLLVKSGSGTLTYGVPTSPGVLDSVVENTIVCDYNSINSIEKAFENNDDIACVIIEPIAGNMGLIPAKKDFIVRLKQLCEKNKTLLIFDEVISGFRASYHGAQPLYDVIPDIVCFGKIIGGGLPVGAYASRKEIMQEISPVGPIYQAGTLSGNPLAMHVGKKMLELLEDGKVYQYLDDLGAYLEKGMRDILDENKVSYVINRVGSLLTLFFNDNQKVETFNDVLKSDFDKYALYFQKMLEEGILLPPSQYECMFLNTSMTKEIIDNFLEKFSKVIKEIK